MRPLVPFLLVLLFSSASIAQTLTPERRVAPIGPLTNAAYDQLSPKVASNGDGFVVLWSDQRSVHAPTSSVLNDSLMAAHLDPDGAVTPPEGITISPRFANGALIASDGHDYLAVWGSEGGIFTLPLLSDGRPASAAPVHVDGTDRFAPPMALASNGHGYLLAFANGGNRFWVPLDAGGHPTGLPVTFPPTTNWPASMVVTNDGAYHLIFSSYQCPGNAPCTNSIQDLTVDSHGGAVLHPLTKGSVFGVSAVSLGDRIALAWLGETEEAMVQVFDPAGNAITAVRSLGGVDGSAPTIGWDGMRLLVAAAKDSGVVGFRLTSDGTPIDPTPFRISDTPGYENVALSGGGGRVALVWSAPVTSRENADVYAHVAADFNEIASAPETATRLSNAPEMRHSPAVTAIGNRTLTVWRGGDDGAIEASIDGSAPIVIAAADGTNHHPAVAAIGDTAMIVWRSDSPTQQRVLARRIEGNGNLLDAAPIVVEADATTYVDPKLNRPSIATDGRAYLVAWSGKREIDAKRVAADGTLIDEHRFPAMHPNGFNSTAVKVVWTGDVYLVVFALEPEQGAQPPAVEVLAILASRVSGAGVALDPTFNRQLLSEGGRLEDLSVAASGDHAAVVFGDQSLSPTAFTSSFWSLEFSVANPALPAVERLVESQAAPDWNYGVTSVTVAARGETIAAAWSRDGAAGGEEVHALLLDRGNPFLLAAEDAYDVTAIATADGFRFTYARTDPAAANVAQLFTRDLVFPPARRRAVP